MRPRTLAPLALLAATFAAGCRQRAPTPPRDGPSLVVLMVVDQLTPELISDYAALYTGGFRRLLDDGYRFENATHDHASTATAPGHTTLATGTYPTRHGIVGNAWSVREGDGWRSVYSMEDLESPVLGHPELPGRGPANIERSGLADWVLRADDRARAVSVSRKDRAAIGLAAQSPGEVYWLTPRAAEFVTSTAYMGELPAWVVDFNERVMPRVYADTVWRSQVPPAARALTRPDTSAWESDGEHTFFPHRPADRGDAGDEESQNFWRYELTPFPDRAVVDLAMAAVEARDLGRRQSVDFLGVSLSQTDLVGHYYGPGSREQLDNLLRLDGELARLFTFLDEAVGRGRWVLALSADHGVLEIPEELAELGVQAERLGAEERQELLTRIQEGVAAAGSGDQAAAVARSVSSLDFVERAYTFEEVERATPADSFAVLYRNSHSRDKAVGMAQRWGVYTRWRPNTLLWASSPATHGSPYYYDRHVPLIFLGAGIRPGVSSERAATVDAAPTLARLAGISAPDDLDGRSLEEVRAR